MVCGVYTDNNEKNIWTQYFCGPKILDQNNFWPDIFWTRKFLVPKSISPLNVFRPNIFLDSILFLNQIFLDPKFCFTQHFFGTTSFWTLPFWTKNLFRTKIFLSPKYFYIIFLNKLLGPKIFLDHNIFKNKKCICWQICFCYTKIDLRTEFSSWVGQTFLHLFPLFVWVWVLDDS